MANQLILTALVWGKGKKFNAACPQLDLILTGETPEAALGLLNLVITSRVQHDLDALYNLYPVTEHEITVAIDQKEPS